MKNSVHVCFGILLVLIFNTVSADDNQIIVFKDKRELVVQNDGKIIKRYQVATGSGDGYKRRIGDNKTPLGQYKIVAMKASDRFHYFMHIDYPNVIDAWYGYQNKLIDGEAFRLITQSHQQNKIPPQNTQLGGFIGLHGIGDTTESRRTIHENIDWTQGCIALSNQDIVDLKQFVKVGTVVIIRE